jgi:acetyltransferase
LDLVRLKGLIMHPLDSLLKPRSIAVVGASRRPGSIGREILHQLIEFEYRGKLFPVNPQADFIHSMKAYPSVSSIPDPVDLAIIVVPREAVPAVVEDCGKKGVKGLVVITAGFSETGEEGRRMEAKLSEWIRGYGMRMIGPNCMGLINTDPAVHMDSTFAPTLPMTGRIAFMSQSGALGFAILNIAKQLDIGFSYFVSLGNRTDVSSNDMLLYWEDDPNTDLILMYLESFGNTKRFMRIARRISKRKPILAVKSGRTEAGARAASSHTGALSARQGLDIAADALLEQSGVIRVNTVEELFDLALGFSKNPLPRGNRLAILTNAGGPAIMATDRAVSLGLQLAALSENSRQELRRLVPSEAVVHNPVDMTGKSDRSRYDACAKILLEDENVDSLLVVFVPVMTIDAMDIVAGLEALRKKYDKPVFGVFMATDEFFQELNEKHPSHMAIYLFPESAVQALAAMDRYRQWREKPIGEVRSFDVDRASAVELLNEVRRQGRADLTPAEARRLLECYSIPVARSAVAKDATELGEIAQGVRYPVVLKAVAPGLVHKTEAGAVRLDIHTPEELMTAAQKMTEEVKRRLPPVSLADRQISFLVQEYVRGGREVIVGMTHDPKFGPLVMFGLGGIYVETFKDVVFRVPPITDLEAQEMIRQIRGYRLLEGVRGEPAVDLRGLAEILERFSQLVEDLPQLAEMDINPFMVFPEAKDFRAVDIRVRLAEK